MKNSTDKIRLFLLSALVLSLPAKVSCGTGDWKVYRAYNEATAVAETPRLIFAVYDGSLLSFNPADNEVKTYSTISGLHDTDIKFMQYCREANALILVYSSGNIDIFESENNIFNLSDIPDKREITDKTINNLEIINGNAYLSTAFGIVEIDIKKRTVVGDYRIANTRSVCIKGDSIYAATSDGIRKAHIKSNMKDGDSWHPAEDFKDMSDPRQINKILFFDDCFFALYDWNHIAIKKQGEPPAFFRGEALRMFIHKDKLVILAAGEIYFYDDQNTYSHLPLAVNDLDCNNTENRYWIAPKGKGLAGIKISAGYDDYTVTVDEIKVNSPKRNIDYKMSFDGGKLFITGGGRSADRFSLSGTLMICEKGQWFNLDENKVAAQTGFPCLDLMAAAADPRDANHYFVSSWGEGVYEFKNNEFIKLHSLNNSSLQTSLPNSSHPDRYVRTGGLSFDKNNNLYVANSVVVDGFSVLSADSKWQSHYYEGISGKEEDGILTDSRNRKWMNIWRIGSTGANVGIFVVDEANNFSSFSSKFIDQLNTPVDVSTYLCMAEDKNGDIWVGTDNGPIIIPSPQYVESGKCYRRTVLDEYGENKYILEKERINAITVDAGNRKWLGTENLGLFVIDESEGEIKISNYTVDNSLLLSNRILSLALDPETGELFTGTDRGLCSLMTGATRGQANYSNVYVTPNPVNPSKHNLVTITGLMPNSTVKITDLAGNLIVESLSRGGQFDWDLKNRSGATVKSGIYPVFAATERGEQGVVTKIMIIK
ncbi:MAG: hypothetical protein LBJ17_05440 [Dysgonamonadaceae bacterium]|jgi:hypothetical protein|nr:hypothetical protein [Dysgonamonadaceae bacterium]